MYKYKIGAARINEILNIGTIAKTEFIRGSAGSHGSGVKKCASDPPIQRAQVVGMTGV